MRRLLRISRGLECRIVAAALAGIATGATLGAVNGGLVSFKGAVDRGDAGDHGGLAGGAELGDGAG